MNVCTAPIGKNITEINPDLILNILEIDNTYSIALFDIPLRARITKNRSVNVKAYGVVDQCGNIKVFGMATNRLVANALNRIDKTAGRLARTLLDYK